MVIKKYLGEIWRPVRGYEGWYEVSNFGRVRSLTHMIPHYCGGERIVRGKILKQYFTKWGYKYVMLYKDGVSKHSVVHRLVAEAFIPNPNNLPCVNHKDEDKTNNHVENLEWCTYAYNNNYGTKKKRISKAKTNGKRSKLVLQYTLNGEFVAEYPSGREVERQKGFEQASIGRCCLGKQKSAYGYIWKYKNPSV